MFLAFKAEEEEEEEEKIMCAHLMLSHLLLSEPKDIKTQHCLYFGYAPLLALRCRHERSISWQAFFPAHFFRVDIRTFSHFLALSRTFSRSLSDGIRGS
jgi:hypothetical protein